MKINGCSDCGVAPTKSHPAEGSSLGWSLRCPKCGKVRVSMFSESELIKTWNKDNAARAVLAQTEVEK